MPLRSPRFLITLLTVLLCLPGFAQQRPIGYWRAHLPYNNAQGLATDGQTLYTISDKGFFTYNPVNGDEEKYSKVEGMHETGTTAIAYDLVTKTCIIGYKNCNIDLFSNNNFKVLPDLKDKSFSGSKAINHIFAADGFAFLSTSLGIVVIDLARQEVKETYVFSKHGQTISINAFTEDSNYFYAATTNGLYRTSRNNANPQVFSSWQGLDTIRNFTQLSSVGNKSIYTAAADTVFQLNNTVLSAVYQDSIYHITRLDGGVSTLYIGLFGKTNGAGILRHLSPSNVIIDSTHIGYPKGTVETLDGKRWMADAYQGLALRENNIYPNFHVPAGPNSPDNTGLWVHNGDLWIAHGGYDLRYNPVGSYYGISNFHNENWTIYQPYNYPLFQDSVLDFIDIIKDINSGTVYAGTYNHGLWELKADGSARIYKSDLSSQGATNPSAASLALDNSGNLFVTQFQTNNELAVHLSTGAWYHYPVQDFGRGVVFHLGLGLLVDDYNQKWFYSALGNGVIVYDDGGTPDNPADDRQKLMTTGKNPGEGNLPNMVVRCLAKDRDGAIWIGTDAGIGIVNCPGGVLDNTCDAEQRVVQYDQFAGLLFGTESVRAIAVDGANQKWVGTLNGIWLLSPDATKILNRFTVDNSPLPSNTIQKIVVDPITGDVYIGTDQGLISYRGVATEGNDANGAVQVFPNPVSSSYTGPVAIRGLVTDADVRITDITGKLIYRAKATGGQVVWNGMDYTGHRPQSGVCLIFTSNKDGSQTNVGKLLFMH